MRSITLYLMAAFLTFTAADATVNVTAETDVGTLLVKLPDASEDTELPVAAILFFYGLTGLGPDHDPYTGVYALPVPCSDPGATADSVYEEHVKAPKEAKGYVEIKSVPLVNTARLFNYDVGLYGVFRSADELAVAMIMEKNGRFFFVEGYLAARTVEEYPALEETLVDIVLSARFVEQEGR